MELNGIKIQWNFFPSRTSLEVRFFQRENDSTDSVVEKDILWSRGVGIPEASKSEGTKSLELLLIP